MVSTNEIARFTNIRFKRFKAFKRFSIKLTHFNILVGPNNAGKSTILTAFRILAAAMRRATSRKAIPVNGPDGMVLGHPVDLSSISIGEENIFFNYDESYDAEIVFTLSNKNSLTLYFSASGGCILVPETYSGSSTSPKAFKKQFNCTIGFVPILGPVEHNEALYAKEAARQALFNYRAARNFRNIWHHYPEYFDDFRAVLRQTWPGMDIERPEIDSSHKTPRLHMFCPEDRIPRELFWSGFGFQVWCQMLTHLIQSKESSIFLIDEPDIYLHSDLQRQLLALLRNMGPDILIATHSTEIISEAETDEIVLINKNRHSPRRLNDPGQLAEVFDALGSNKNPILTQLAKTRRVLFVEGKDFQILGKFARKMNRARVGNRQDFAVVMVEGFSPERIRNLKNGMEITLGNKIASAAILDRDYRFDEECAAISSECARFCTYVTIHERKEIENFLAVPDAIDRALSRRLADHNRRTGSELSYLPEMRTILNEFAESKKSYTTSQILSKCRQFCRISHPNIDDRTINEKTLDRIEELWSDIATRLNLISGKDALSHVNKFSQKRYGISVTPTAIIDAMTVEEIPEEMVKLIDLLDDFSTMSVK